MDSNPEPAYKIERIAELPGHDDRAWHVAWNPTKPLLASCSADKTVRIYGYKQLSSPDSPVDVTFSHLSTIPTGHSKTVRAIAWSPSGNTLATASFDSNIGIWEQEPTDEDENDDLTMREWECLSLLEGHETECKDVAYSSSGTLLASCSRDKTVWIWEVHPDADFECLGVLMEHSQDVKAVAWHPHEEILASASYDDTIKLYVDDPSEDWFCFATLQGHDSTVWSLSWSPDGNYFASASDDKTIRIWKRVETYKFDTVLVLTGHDRSVYSVTWGKGINSPQSLGWIASTGGDGLILIWEISEKSVDAESASGLCQKLIGRYSSAHGVCDVNTLAWCPREGYENILATAGDDGAARVWRVVPA